MRKLITGKASPGYRNNVVFYFFLIFMGLSFITRLILTFKSLDMIEYGLTDFLNIYIRGVVFDFSAAAYFLLPLIIYFSLAPVSLLNLRYHDYLLNLLSLVYVNILVFNSFSEIIFWDEFGKRFNFIAVDYLVYTHEVINNIRESYPMVLIFSLVFVISIFILAFVRKNMDLAGRSHEKNTSKCFYKTAAVYLLVMISIFNFLDQRSFADFTDNQFENELSKNGIYSLFSAFVNNTLDYQEFYRTTDKEAVMNRLEELSGFNEVKNNEIAVSGPEKKYNVMLIMLESMSAEFLGVYGNRNNLTPNLDKLAEKSVFFERAYATGTRTVRGMEAVTLSMVPTPGRSIVKRPDNHNMFSSGFIFREKGYENKFIYAGYGYFDNMNDFFSHNGFDIVDRTDMKSKEISFANVWGVCDENLYDKCLSEADKSFKKGKPFFNFIMTTSNHRPYTYPDNRVDIASHTGRPGGVKYCDYALNRFLEKAESKKWFKNTLFVIIADHNGGSAGRTELPIWRYRIPFYIYAPYLIKPMKVRSLCSQVDVMPTLFGMLNWNYSSRFYGDDILGKDHKERAFIGTYQKLGLYRDDKLIILTPDKCIKEYEVTENNLRSCKYRSINPLKTDVEDILSYYQSASYFYKNRTGCKQIF
jgi:phosphoglycerol transferase MdoB-like AlkP superfamily enzyme